MINKTDLYNQCVEKLQTQLDEMQDAIDKVQESIEGEHGIIINAGGYSHTSWCQCLHQYSQVE